MSLLIAGLLIVTLGSCKDEVKDGYYYCPMHSEVHEHNDVPCPVCSMKLEFKKEKGHHLKKHDDHNKKDHSNHDHSKDHQK